MLGAGRKGRKTTRAIRRLTRLLGPVRELDVALEMLGELQAAPDAPVEAIAVLRQVIGRERATLQHDLECRLDPGACQQLPRHLLRAVPRAPGAVASADGVRAWAMAARRAWRLQVSIEKASSLYLPDRLHEVRIAAKKLRYACEIVGEVERSALGPLTGRLKRLQDLLGRMHDLEVLILRTRSVLGSPLAADPVLSASLDRLVGCLETECRRLHARYMASRKRLVSDCERVVTASCARRTAVA